MKRKGIIYTLIAACATSVCLAAQFSVGKTKQTEAYAAELVLTDDNAIHETYFVGSEVNFPESVTLTYGDSQTVIASEYTLTYPDGRVYGEKETFTLEEVGQYTIAYSAVADERLIVARKNFKVVEEKYAVSGNNSSITPPNDGDKLTVKLSDGETFYYNVPLKLEEGLENSVIKLYLKQCDYTASVDMTYLKVRLTDCYDSSNYVQFSLYCYAGQGYVHIYAQTGFTGTAYDNGLDKNKDTPYVYEGESYMIRNTGLYGRSMSNYHSEPLTFYYNPTTMKSFIAADGTDKFLVNALDNVDINGKKFGGFTTNEVYMSVFGTKYVSTSSEVDIYSIFGCAASDLNAGEYVDETKPVIVVNGEKTTENGVYAAVGERVVIPQTDVYDVNLKSITSAVYYNYGTAYATLVNVQDGGFVPERTGTYTIVYTATDTFGNERKEKFLVYCIGGAEKGITLLSELPSIMTAGEKVSLGIPEISGINGNVSVKIKAYRNENETEYESGTLTFAADGTLLSGAELSFIPKGYGTYTVEYIYGDNVNDYVLKKTLECVANEESYYAFISTPVLPKYFVENATYQLPSLAAYSFTGEEPTATASQLYVKYDDGEFAPVENISAFTVGSGEKLYFQYRKENAETEIYAAEIFSVGYGTKNLAIENYFKGDFSANAYSGYVEFKALNAGEKKTISFVNPVFSEKFVVGLYLSQNTSFKRVKVILTDYYDPTVTNQFVFTENGSGYTFEANGGVRTEVAASLRTETAVTYDADAQKLLLQDGGKVAYTFAGSGLYYLTIECENVLVGDGVRITQINNQRINNKTKDISDPEIVVENLSGDYARGTQIFLPVATFNDVLSPVRDSECSVRVVYLGANGQETVVAVDGTKLDGEENDVTKSYAFVLEKFGEYKAYYSGPLSDGSIGTLYELRFSSISTQPPSITFNDGKGENITVNVKVGAKHMVRAFTAESLKDGVLVNDDKNAYTFVVVYDDHLDMVSSGENNFVASYAGKYTVTVYCMDSDGNIATASYFVVAK